MASFLAPHACSSELEKAASASKPVGGTFLKVLAESSVLTEPSADGLVMQASHGGCASSLFDPQEVHLCTRGHPPRVPRVSLSAGPTARWAAGRAVCVGVGVSDPAASPQDSWTRAHAQGGGHPGGGCLKLVPAALVPDFLENHVGWLGDSFICLPMI